MLDIFAVFDWSWDEARNWTRTRTRMIIFEEGRTVTKQGRYLD